jgi:hypothetical protein
MFSRTFTGIIASSKGGGVVLTQSIIYDDSNYYPAANGPAACNPTVIPPNPPPMPMPIDIWYSGTGGIGDFIYYDSFGTTAFNGGFGWWKTDITAPPLSVQISPSGEILSTYSC